MNIEQFVKLLGQEKATAILRTDDQQKAALAMEAAIRGGFKFIEFTLTIPGAFELIQDFSNREILQFECKMNKSRIQLQLSAVEKHFLSTAADKLQWVLVTTSTNQRHSTDRLCLTSRTSRAFVTS